MGGECVKAAVTCVMWEGQSLGGVIDPTTTTYITWSITRSYVCWKSEWGILNEMYCLGGWLGY